MEKKLSSNMEDYLEAIIALQKKNGVAMVRDIGRHLGVKNSSVTSALNTLSKSGFAVHERYGYVELTREGEHIAQLVQKRHDILTKFLIDILSVDPKTAGEDACKMEHALSPQTSQRLTKFIEFLETCPDGDKPEWLKNFQYYLKTGKRLTCSGGKKKKKP
jgi:DtxR family Mn-dependent transcriptional regulator